MYFAVDYPQTGNIPSQFPGVVTALDSLLGTQGECNYSHSLYSFQATQLVFPGTLENTVKGALLQKENKMKLIFRGPAKFEFSRSSSEHHDITSEPSRDNSVIMCYYSILNTMNQNALTWLFLAQCRRKINIPLKKVITKISKLYTSHLGKPTLKSF